MKLVRTLATLAAGALWLSAMANVARADKNATPDNAETEFVRITNNASGRPQALQAAIARYERRGLGDAITVDLVSALHIADQPYYATLNELFTEYDVLLYELIAPAGTTVDASQRPTGLLSRAQLAMTSGLNLSFQLEQIDYSAKNFMHADLSPSELSAAMKARGETPLVFLWRIFVTSMQEAAKDPMGVNSLATAMGALGPGGSESLKVTLARELTDMSQVQSVLGDNANSSIIGARNERAIDILREQLDAGATRIGIFYGAAHMPDFERRLIEELGMTYSRSEWIDAWQLAN